MGIRDTATRVVFGGARQVARTGSGAARQGLGALQRLRGARAAASPQRPKDLGDADLTNKVRTEVLRGLRGDAKGDVDINVVDGAVYLRGTAKNPEAINRLEEKARAIPEVREVHNLLHLPDTPAPTRSDTPSAQRKTRRAGAAPKRPRREPRRVNADKTIAEDAAAPDKLAAKRAGRPAAPLGASEDRDRT
jgi:BON domain